MQHTPTIIKTFVKPSTYPTVPGSSVLVEICIGELYLNCLVGLVPKLQEFPEMNVDLTIRWEDCRDRNR